MTTIKFENSDCLEYLKSIPDRSVDLFLTDPPYSIKKADWDIFESDVKYLEFMSTFVNLCSQKVKTNGSLLLFHNQFEKMASISKVLDKSGFVFNQFCVWNKGMFRANRWKRGKINLRTWFPVCEYILYYNYNEGNIGLGKTGLQKIHSNPNCFVPLKNWYRSELNRLNITDKELKQKYTDIIGKKPNMFRHYFCNSQFELPTKKVYDTVFIPLGFNREYEDLRREYEDLRREYEDLRREYEDLRREYEDLRYYHAFDENHTNVFCVNTVQPGSKERNGHPCQKPVELLSRLVRCCCRLGGVVCDPFAGSGSTAVAAIQEGRSFFGCELNKKWFDISQDRIESEIMKRDFLAAEKEEK